MMEKSDKKKDEKPSSENIENSIKSENEKK